MTNHKPDVRKANPCPPCPPTATAWEKTIYWLGIGLGSGLPKRAAGTWGTVGGLLVAVMVLVLFGGKWLIGLTVVGCLVGSYICGKTSQLMGVHDDPHIVFDEWVGMWMTLLPLAGLFANSPPFDDSANHQAFWLVTFFPMGAFYGVVLPFILFRFFDIVKPFPIKWVDKNVSGGFGILIDDILAAIMALLVWLAFAWLFLGF